MEFKLPKLEDWVDVPAYPGMEMLCWLNPTDEQYEPPEEGRRPWDHELWWLYGRLFLRLKVPAEYNASGEEEIVELGSAEAVYELWGSPGFDKSILDHTMGAWGSQRRNLMLEAAKN